MNLPVISKHNLYIREVPPEKNPEYTQTNIKNTEEDILKRLYKIFKHKIMDL